MGLDFNRPSSGPAPVLEVAPAQGQEEYQAYDVEADRRQMTQIMVNSPEVDSLASQIEVYNLETIVSFGSGAAEEISKCSDVILNSMNMSQLDDSSAMLTTLAKIWTSSTSRRSRTTPACWARSSAGCARSWTRSWPNTTPWARRWTRSMSSSSSMSPRSDSRIRS